MPFSPNTDILLTDREHVLTRIEGERNAFVSEEMKEAFVFATNTTFDKFPEGVPLSSLCDEATTELLRRGLVVSVPKEFSGDADDASDRIAHVIGAAAVGYITYKIGYAIGKAILN